MSEGIEAIVKSLIDEDGDEIEDDVVVMTKSLRLFDSNVDRAKPRNHITQLIFEMEDSLIKLDAKDLTIPKLEEMAVFIYESMSISTRNYHSVQHVFDIINHDKRLQKSPIAILAACFHDCIYYHVDGGLTPTQAVLLDGSFKISGPGDEDASSYHLQSQKIYNFFATDRGETPETGDDATVQLQMVETIFGYTPGQNIRITNDGLNEYLSALVAVRMLSDVLPIEILAQIACCIEATIPFRSASKETGKTHMERLHENLVAVRGVYDLKLSDEELVESVQLACLLSNSDVGNFGTTDRHWFLDNTWSLLPETNESLRNEYVYSVDHFHVALYKMYGFFGFLQPAVVFHEFRGVPDLPEMGHLVKECTNNLAFGRTYVGAKLVAMSLVSAIAVLSGGDAPISLFTGDLRAEERRTSHGNSSTSLNQRRSRFKLSGSTMNPSSSDFLTSSTVDMQRPPKKTMKGFNQAVYEMLADGRRSESSFDTKRSPWAALLYSCIGDEGLNKILKEQTLYPMNEERAWTLLRALPIMPVHSIVQKMSAQALSRTEKIEAIFATLKSEGAFAEGNDP